MKYLSTNAFIKDNFFIITSENLDVVEQRLYGFVFINNKLYVNTKECLEISEYDYGIYVYVRKSPEFIIIMQDAIGAYGLYVYQEDNFFAISNSILYLSNYIKDKRKISLNLNYVKYFMKENLSSRLFDETIVNEIKLLPRDVIGLIDKKKKEIFFERKEVKHKVKINTVEGIKLLDEWYRYYATIISGLLNLNQTIIADISGGFDSRACLALFVSQPNLLSKIIFNANRGKGHTLEEDYKIASEIATQHNFQLNNYSQLNSYLIPDETSLANSFFSKMSVHSQFLCRSGYYKKKVFHFTGAAGEKCRSHWNDTPEEHSLHILRARQFLPSEWDSDLEKFILGSFGKLKQYFNVPDSTFGSCLYIENRVRSHFGKTCVENFLSGDINIAPLSDCRLEQIDTLFDNNIDRTVLLALILTRYTSSLLDVEFDSGKKIDANLLDLAHTLNNRFPFDKCFKPVQLELTDDTQVYPEKVDRTGSPRAKLQELFHDSKHASVITGTIGKRAYEMADYELKNASYFGNSFAVQQLSVSFFREICEYSFVSSLNSSDINIYHRWGKYDSPSTIDIMDKLKTAFLDVVLIGSNDTNAIELFFEDTLHTNFSVPTWLKRAQDRFGFVVESQALKIIFSIKINIQGEIMIRLRGKEIRDKHEGSIPFWIDFTKFVIENKNIISTKTPVCFKKPFIYRSKVKGGEKLSVEVEWSPHGYSQYEFDKLARFIQSII